MEYITVKEAAEKWGVSTRRVQILCAQERVKGAYRFGKSWMIPERAVLPNAYRTKEATCSSPEYCEICDTMFGESLEHDVVTDEAKAPTCTETGLTEGSHCSICDGVIVEQEEIDALGHDWLDATNDAPKTCSVCGETEGEPLERATETETDVNGNETETDMNGDVSEQEKPDKGNTNNEKTEDDANGEGKSSGCGSSIGLGAVAIVMTVGAAVVVKKKED